MTEGSADKRKKVLLPAPGDEKAAGATQDVFARQEDLFTVDSPQQD